MTGRDSYNALEFMSPKKAAFTSKPSSSVETLKNEAGAIRRATPAWALETPSLDAVVRIGVIGCGYWGPNIIRNFQEIAQSKVVGIADFKAERLKPFAKKIPGVKLTADYQDLLKDPAIDAVVIVTPISSHFPIAKAALLAGKHVLVEKPLTRTVKEGRALVALARKQKKILMAGHTFEYHPAVLKIAELIKTQELGAIHYIDSTRVNLGLYQSDNLNVIWDLAPHDISIILHWLGQTPVKVSAWGKSFVKKGIEDVAFMRLEFPGETLAHLHVSWLAPAKIRRMTVVGNKKMIVYDDLENVEKIKIADQGALLDPADPELRVSYRIGDIVSPRVHVTEPLHQECLHFIECILKNEKPRTDGESGLQVVRVLEAANQSIKRGGIPVSL